MRSLVILALCLFASIAQASEGGHAIAMHGAPKYAPTFQHFDYVNPNAPRTGTLKLSFTGTFDNLNPFSVRGTLGAGQGLGGPHLLHETLLARSQDEPFTLYGLIAEKVEAAADRSWVQFTLNPKARWNDGSPITAADVLFSWQQLKEKGRPSHRTYYKNVAKAEITAPSTIRFTFDTTNGINREMPLIMGLMPVLNKAWWEGRDVSTPGLDVPVTSGPYKVQTLEAGRRIVYVRDENHWAKDLPAVKGQWNFAEISYDYYRDRNVALEAFKSGAYDLRREQDPRQWQNGYNSPALQSGQMLKIEEAYQRPEAARGFIFNTRRPLFSDARVRQALFGTLDFDWMNKALYGGIYKRINSYFPNSELAATGLPTAAELALLEPWRADLPPAVFTRPFTMPETDGSGPAGQRALLEEAIAQLATAGWTLQNGTMKNAAGEAMTFEVLLVDPMDEKLALEWRRTLKRLGIELKVRTVDSAQYQSRMTTYDFDMTVNFWTSSLSPGNEQLFYWGSKNADQPGSRNFAGVKSAVIDALANNLAEAQTREDLVAGTRALDRALLWGYYAIPLGFLGRDLVAYWQPLQRPSITPLYGVMPEQTWWRPN